MKRTLFRAGVAAAVCFCLSLGASAVRMLVPVGKVVGLSLSDGSVTVAAFSEELGDQARRAGLQVGDDILAVDGRTIDSAAQLHEALAHSDGTVELTVARSGREHSLSLSPEVTDSGPRLGVWIREGVTGIGTVTWYDPDTGRFGALGHGISSGGDLAEMTAGSIYPATVAGLRRGEAGRPGQLKGAVTAESAIGELTVNCKRGVFGSCRGFSGEPMPVGQAVSGPVKILSNISGEEVAAFDAEITCLEATPTGRDMLIRITDPALLTATGGIVAGMSGSPILQNGCLVGAVTHVLVNDPTTGYGIFIENMLDAAA